MGGSKRKEKVLLISIPKSGTHIIELLLRNLGYVSKYSNDKLNYLNTNLFEANPNSNNEFISFWGAKACFNWPNLLSLLDEGMILFGHLDFTLNHYVTNEKIILAKRNLKHQIVSFYKHCTIGLKTDAAVEKWIDMPYGVDGLMQYMQSNIFKNGHYKQYTDSLLPWFKVYPNNVVKFEDLTSSDQNNQLKACSKISQIINVPENEIFAALNQTLGVKTKTFTGKVDGGFNEIWTDDVDKLFYKLGLDKLNKELGYE